MIDFFTTLMTNYYWLGVLISFVIITIYYCNRDYVEYKDNKWYHIFSYLLMFLSWITVGLSVLCFVIFMIYFVIVMMFRSFGNLFNF